MENAKILAKHFKTFLKFKNLSKNTNYDELLNIDGIGDTQVNSIKNFLSNKVNLDVLNSLHEILNVQNKLIEKKKWIIKKSNIYVNWKT